VADHDRARRRRLGGHSLQPAGSAHPVGRERAELLRDVGCDGGERVVVAGLDPHHARLLRRAEPDREHRAEHDRDLAEDVPGTALADDALDPVDDLDRLDAALEDREQRALGALVRGVLARRERDVGRCPREPLALLRAEAGEDRDGGDLPRRHHGRCPGMGGMLRPARQRRTG
jgi:hypothetical protein